MCRRVVVDTDLDFNGLLPQYRDTLNITGQLFSTVNLVLEQVNALIDPNLFFVLGSMAGNGLMIRLIRELDRDVSPLITELGRCESID